MSYQKHDVTIKWTAPLVSEGILVIFSCNTHTHATHTHRYAVLSQRNIMSAQAINKCSKPFKYDILPFLPSSSPSSSRLKRDTHQLCDRSRDGCSIDPEGGSGGGRGGRGGRLMLQRNCVRSATESLNHTGSSVTRLQNKAQ